MIAIVDYGMGNLRSVQKAFEAIGIEAYITQDLQVIEEAKALVLPGVGAFPDAMVNLREQSLDEKIKIEVAKGKPLLGICLGMQLLFEYGYEVEGCRGLSFMKGEILQLPQGNKIPHMGWNQLKIKEDSRLLQGVDEGAFVYFVHSFYGVSGEEGLIKATTDYGLEVPAVVEKGNLFGLQFHPEKSGEVGLKILRNFGELIK